MAVTKLPMGGKTRGVEHPIAEDMALIGNTSNHLHNAPLPKKCYVDNSGNKGGPSADYDRDGM